MDYLEGGDLYKRLKSEPKLGFEEQVKIAWEYAESLVVLHDQLQLVHFDQKPENTFLTKDGHPRIADFGFTVKIGAIQGFVGTEGFIAPEVVVMATSQNLLVASPSADVWSMGCVFAELIGSQWIALNGQDDGDYQKIFNHLEGLKDKVFPNRDDPHSMDWVIDHCLQLNPEDRLTAKAVATILKGMHMNNSSY